MSVPAERPRSRAAFRLPAISPVVAAALGFLSVVLLLALAAPLLPLASPDVTHLDLRLLPPFSAGHLLGTDQLGRDILARLVFGTRVSLAVGIGAALAAGAIGSAVGLAAGFFGRWTDMSLMRGIDVLMAFPYLLLALAIVAALGPGLVNAMVAIVIVNIPFFARLVRGTTLAIVHTDFIAAARLSGRSNLGIVLFELLPNVFPTIVVALATTIGWMILETAGLSFLGLGAQPPQADLGGMLGDGRNLTAVAPHVATIPGLMILILAIAINVVGDGVRDALDPRLKSGGVARAHPATEVVRQSSPSRQATAPDAALTIVELETHFRFGHDVYRAVNGVSFTVAPGQSVGIVGESGSGKTVTALSILRLVPSPPGAIVGGAIFHHDEELTRMGLARLQEIRGNRVGFVFQDSLTTLNPLITVGEQISETIRRHRANSSRDAWLEAVRLMEAVHIADAKARAFAFPHELSGGQRQRIGIAIALANDPDLIIADEPTTALDATTQAQILKLMTELIARRNAALIFISHDVNLVAELCNTVHVMYAGRIVESGPVDEVLRAPAHPYTRGLLASAPRLGRKAALVPIPGMAPPTNALPQGCAFAPRCALVVPACTVDEIPPVAAGAEHWARCMRIGETM